MNKTQTPKQCRSQWIRTGDTDYDWKTGKTMKLAEDPAANQDGEPGIVRAPNEPAEVPPAVVMQKTGERNLNRYKPLQSSIVNQSYHNIKMSNGAVLRKSVVALKKAKIAKKLAPGQIAAPPTPRDLKRKLLASSSQQSSSKRTMGTSHRTMGNRSRLQILKTSEDSESEEEDYLPLISTKPAVDPTTKGADAERERQGSSSGGQDQEQPEIIKIRPGNYETATRYTMAREQEIEANRRKEDTERNIPQEVERKAEQIPATG